MMINKLGYPQLLQNEFKTTLNNLVNSVSKFKIKRRLSLSGRVLAYIRPWVSSSTLPLTHKYTCTWTHRDTAHVQHKHTHTYYITYTQEHIYTERNTHSHKCTDTHRDMHTYIQITHKQTHKHALTPVLPCGYTPCNNAYPSDLFPTAETLRGSLLPGKQTAVGSRLGEAG